MNGGTKLLFMFMVGSVHHRVHGICAANAE
jgi:hypothetical protein